MAFSKTKKTGWACLALMAAVGTAAVMSGGSASLVEDPELSPAEIVALRFPADAEELASASSAQADPSTARDIEQQVLAILAFNPDPLGIPAPRAWAATQVAEPGDDYVDASAPGTSAERNGTVTAALSSRPAPARAKRRPLTLFNDAQIASIKERLRLSRDQEQYWPKVEAALRFIGWRHSRPHTGAQVPTLDPDDVERVKAAAVPLIMTLREDQKREVRVLAHVMGLEKLAAQF
jgi:hypothetical protein